MTDLERERIARDAAGQGAVYAVALVAVLLFFLLAHLGPALKSVPPQPPAPAEQRPPPFQPPRAP